MFIAELRQIESSSARSDMLHYHYIPLLTELRRFCRFLSQAKVSKLASKVGCAHGDFKGVEEAASFSHPFIAGVSLPLRVWRLLGLLEYG